MKFGIQRPAVISFGERLPVLGGTVKQSYNRWLRFKYALDWNFLRNPSARRKFQVQKPALTPVQRRVVEDLRTRGIAFAKFSELLSEDLWNELSESVRTFACGEPVQIALREYRAEFAKRIGAGGGVLSGRGEILKKYLITLYPDTEMPSVSLDNEWLRLGTGAPVLDIVNSYFGLLGKLIYFDLWHTVTVDTDGQRFGSQEWHRDPEDRRKLRLYLYFSDVDADCGPLQFVPGSCMGGPYEGLWPWQGHFGTNYLPKGELERRIPASEWITATGEAGTCVFCDTSGLHRGGVSTTRPRILATWAFVTPASLHRQRYQVDGALARRGLTNAAKFALT